MELITSIRDSEANIEAVTDSGFAQRELGTRAPELYRVSLEALEILTNIASCAAGCRGESHIIENLLRRYVNALLAARKLAWAGYYDEAIALLRTAAEILNLLQLFSLDQSSQSRWHERYDKNEFSPVKVRLAIEKVG